MADLRSLPEQYPQKPNSARVSLMELQPSPELLPPPPIVPPTGNTTMAYGEPKWELLPLPPESKMMPGWLAILLMIVALLLFTAGMLFLFVVLPPHPKSF